jgi:hypothetical protein
MFVICSGSLRWIRTFLKSLLYHSANNKQRQFKLVTKAGKVYQGQYVIGTTGIQSKKRAMNEVWYWSRSSYSLTRRSPGLLPKIVDLLAAIVSPSPEWLDFYPLLMLNGLC